MPQEPKSRKSQGVVAPANEGQLGAIKEAIEKSATSRAALARNAKKALATSTSSSGGGSVPRASRATAVLSSLSAGDGATKAANAGQAKPTGATAALVAAQKATARPVTLEKEVIVQPQEPATVVVSPQLHQQQNTAAASGPDLVSHSGHPTPIKWPETLTTTAGQRPLQQKHHLAQPLAMVSSLSSHQQQQHQHSLSGSSLSAGGGSATAVEADAKLKTQPPTSAAASAAAAGAEAAASAAALTASMPVIRPPSVAAIAPLMQRAQQLEEKEAEKKRLLLLEQEQQEQKRSASGGGAAGAALRQEADIVARDPTATTTAAASRTLGAEPIMMSPGLDKALPIRCVDDVKSVVAPIAALAPEATQDIKKAKPFAEPPAKAAPTYAAVVAAAAATAPAAAAAPAANQSKKSASVEPSARGGPIRPKPLGADMLGLKSPTEAKPKRAAALVAAPAATAVPVGTSAAAASAATAAASRRAVENVYPHQAKPQQQQQQPAAAPRAATVPPAPAPRPALEIQPQVQPVKMQQLEAAPLPAHSTTPDVTARNTAVNQQHLYQQEQQITRAPPASYLNPSMSSPVTLIEEMALPQQQEMVLPPSGATTATYATPTGYATMNGDTPHMGPGGMGVLAPTPYNTPVSNFDDNQQANTLPVSADGMTWTYPQQQQAPVMMDNTNYTYATSPTPAVIQPQWIDYSSQQQYQQQQQQMYYQPQQPTQDQQQNYTYYPQEQQQMQQQQPLMQYYDTSSNSGGMMMHMQPLQPLMPIQIMSPPELPAFVAHPLPIPGMGGAMGGTGVYGDHAVWE